MCYTEKFTFFFNNVLVTGKEYFGLLFRNILWDLIRQLKVSRL